MAFFSLARGNGCQQKQKKLIDQRAPQIGYEGIKSLRSLAMKNYLVTGGLLSLVESYNNLLYFVITKNDVKKNLHFNAMCSVNFGQSY